MCPKEKVFYITKYQSIKRIASRHLRYILKLRISFFSNHFITLIIIILNKLLCYGKFPEPVLRTLENKNRTPILHSIHTLITHLAVIKCSHSSYMHLIWMWRRPENLEEYVELYTDSNLGLNLRPCVVAATPTATTCYTSEYIFLENTI